MRVPNRLVLVVLLVPNDEPAGRLVVAIPEAGLLALPKPPDLKVWFRLDLNCF